MRQSARRGALSLLLATSIVAGAPATRVLPTVSAAAAPATTPAPDLHLSHGAPLAPANAAPYSGPDPDWAKPPAPEPVEAPPGTSFAPRPELPDGDATAKADAKGRTSRLTRSPAPTTDQLAAPLTPTERTVATPGGHLALDARSRPTRKRNAKTNNWEELDGTITKRPDGRLGPRVPLADVSFASDAAAGSVATVASDAGTFAISHPNARPVAARTDGARVQYDNALANGATLVEEPKHSGFEESVIVASRAAGNGYDATIALPAGVRARQAAKSIEFVKGAKTIAAFGDGFAFDAAPPSTGPGPVETPVSVTLIAQQRNIASVRVEVPSGWFGDPTRVFPVTIDPDFSQVNTTAQAGGGDTYLENTDPSPHWDLDKLRVGTYDGGVHRDRALLKFPVGNLTKNPHVRVNDASLTVWNYFSGTCALSAQTQANLYALASPAPLNVNWDNQPGAYQITGQPTANWTGRYDQTGACAEGYRFMDATQLAKSWVQPNGIANNGMLIVAADESSNLGWKKFYSSNSYTPPTLRINYDYYDAEYGAARSWTRPAGQPFDVGVWVHNKTLTDWNGFRYQLRAYTQVNGANVRVGTGLIPTGVVKAGDWYLFDIKMNAMPVGATAVYFTMADASVAGTNGEFWKWGAVNGGGSLDIVPTSTLGVPAYTTLDGGYVNPFSGNFHYETTDLSVPSIGPELKLTRSYNSEDKHVGWFGPGWTSTYETHLEWNSLANVTLVHPDGRREMYTYAPGYNVWVAPPGYTGVITEYPSLGISILTDKKNTQFIFSHTSSPTGALVSITDEHGDRLDLSLGSDNHVDYVQSPITGKALHFTWNANRSRITSAYTSRVVAGDDSSRLTWTYTYYNGELQYACDPRPIANHCWQYEITQPQMNFVRRPSGKQEVALSYDTTGKYPGRVTSRKDGLNKITSYAYSVSGTGLSAQQRTEVTDANAHKTTFAYNLDGQAVFIKDPKGNFKRFTYDTDDPNNHDPKGFLTKVASYDPVTNKYADTITYGRDAKGNVTTQTDQLGRTSYASYDKNSHLTASADARSAHALDTTYLVENKYDSAGHLTKRTYPKPSYLATAPFEQWTYTDGTESASGGGTAPKGLLETERDRNGNLTRYTYTSEDFVAKVTTPSGLVTTYEYDGIGRKLQEHEQCDNCSVTSALTTITTYDALSQPVDIIEPAFDDRSAGGLVHQRKTHNVYDDDENLIETQISDVGGSTTPDPTRITRHTYDDNGVETVTTAPDGGQTIKTFDPVGNVLTVQDPNGNVTRTSYDELNRPIKGELLGYRDDPASNTAPYDLALSTTGYDPFGRKTSEALASARRTKFAYDVAGQLTTTSVLDFYGPGQPFVAESDTYDDAGNVTKQVTGDGKLSVSTDYDVIGRLRRTKEDPSGRNRVTEFERDGNGNVTVRTVGDGNTTHPVDARTDDTYDSSDHVLTETVENQGTAPLRTAYTYDERGNRLTAKDARQNTTSYSYDAADHLTATRAPAVTLTTAGADGTTSSVNGQPISYNAYDTFDQVVSATDANGNATTTTFDVPGRTKTVTFPTYAPVDGSAAITPTERWAYDADGNLLSHTDRAGQTSSYAYTRRNQVFMQTDPLVSGASTRGTVHTIYDAGGRKSQVIDENNHSMTWNYDTLDRMTSQTQDVYVASAWRHDTTTFGYDGLSNQTSVTSPLGETTTQAWSPVGEHSSTTAPLEDGTTATTTYGYDRLSRQIKMTEPGGRTTRNVYDEAGRPTSTGQYASSTATAPTTQVVNGYDANGNRTSQQTLRGVAGSYSTKYVYDPANRLTSVERPIDGTTSITTSYGYDAADNLTKTTQPKTATVDEVTAVRYNAWNLPDMVIEPSTGAGPVTDRTYRTVYDGAGRSVRDLGPGGVTVTSVFDELGRLKSQQASGGGGANASKSFGYDLVGNMTSASAPGGLLVFGYDDKNLLTSAAGPAGGASFSYNENGQLVGRTDAAGAATFGWTKRGQLKTLSDPLTGATLTNSWDRDGRLTKTTMPSGAHRDYTYDPAGRPATDTLTSATNAVTASSAYSYDSDGNLATKTIGPAAVAGAGTNSYGYDRANRLATWTAPNNTTTVYGYDLAGNRTTAGSKTFTYDTRNRLTADNAGKTYTWSTAGWLTNNAGTTITYDAFGRPLNNAGVTVTYDALDRIAARNNIPFTYSGKDPDPISDGTFTTTHTPAGAPIAYRDPTGTRLALTDTHTDVTGLANVDGTLAQSTSYNPFGEPTATVGTQPRVGYQSNYTDPTSKQSKMGARWYAPNLDTFTTRDTNPGTANDPISTNRYTYANNNPLTNTDPTGHSILDSLASSMNKVAADMRAQAAVNALPPQAQIELFMAGRAAQMRELLKSAGATGPALDYYSPKNFPRLAPVQILDHITLTAAEPQTISIIDLDVKGNAVVRDIDITLTDPLVALAYSAASCRTAYRGETTSFAAGAGAPGWDRVVASLPAMERNCIGVEQAARRVFPKENLLDSLKEVGHGLLKLGVASLGLVLQAACVPGDGATAGLGAVACHGAVGFGTSYAWHATDGHFTPTLGDALAGLIAAGGSLIGEVAPQYLKTLRGATATEEPAGAGSSVVKFEPYPSNGGLLGEPIEDTLQPGARISRYGGAGGRYASPEGVPFGERGLPPAAAKSYTVYEVAKPVDVQGGIAQYWMGGGGGVQYRFAQPIQELVDEGVLKVVGP